MSRDSEPLVPKQFREDLEDLTRINPYKVHTWTKDVYDRENNSYFGRTPKGWWYLFLGYFVLWSIWTLIVAISFATFYYNLSMDVPRWFAHQPTFAVSPCDIENTKFCGISFKSNNKDTYDNYAKTITTFLEKYGEVDTIKQNFGDCNRNNLYGFGKEKPCVFLKINRVIGYTPEVYERDKELPNYAPTELKDYIKSLDVKERLKRIWISCEADKNISITYIPKRYVEADLLKVSNKIIKRSNTKTEEETFYSKEDFERIIAIQLSDFGTDEVVIDCYMWAKNILISEDHEHGAGRVLIRIKLK